MQKEKYPIDIAENIRLALLNNEPIVALESTIITHGMHFPINMNTALDVENIIRQNNAIPATIAIIQGRIKIGLDHSQIEYLAKEGQKVSKCSRRDLASILSQKKDGSTTVAATMICAQMAGIRIFVTGGIGGVHRGAEQTFDISADLIELGKTQVAVISAGAKSILDISKTLEYLETQGVPVLGFQTNDFPEFFTSKSGYQVSHKMDTEKECADLIHMQFEKLDLKTGILVTIPVPQEEEANGQTVKVAIEQALKEANEQNISGAKITPFLLGRINQITEGDSSRSNIALIKNNAALGARIAVEYSNILKSGN